MAHKVLIGGTAYGIKGGKTMVNGTAYPIKKGRTLVGGTGYDIAFPSDETYTIVVTLYCYYMYGSEARITVNGNYVGTLAGDEGTEYYDMPLKVKAGDFIDITCTQCRPTTCSGFRNEFIWEEEFSGYVTGNGYVDIEAY